MSTVNLPVINPSSIDLEIQQFLIQTGYDRDAAAASVHGWLNHLEMLGEIDSVHVAHVINNKNQFHVSYRFPGKSSSFQQPRVHIGTTYDVTKTMLGIGTTPMSTAGSAQAKGRVPIKNVSGNDRLDSNEDTPQTTNDPADDYDRAMGGL